MIDATGAPPKPNLTVLVRDGRISRLGTNVDIPADARVVDLDGSPSIWTGQDLDVYVEIADEQQARSAVRAAKQDGADFVKVYSRLTRETLFAIADEARQLGIPFAGYVADAVPVVEAAQAGQRSFEHVFPALLGVSSDEAGVRQILAEIKLGSGSGGHDWFDQHRAADVFGALTAAGAAFTPTLIMHHITDRPDETCSRCASRRSSPPWRASGRSPRSPAWPW